MKKILMIAALYLTSQYTIKAQTNFFVLSDGHSLLTGTCSVLSAGKINNNHFLTSDTSGPNKDREYYTTKSRKKRNTGLALVGVGTGLIGIGFLVGNRNASSFGEAEAGVIMGCLGFLTALGSIPCFISASLNKHKATVTVSSQSVSPRIRLNIKAVTGITLNIPLSK